MKRFRADYTHVVERQCFAYVNAESADEAIELVKNYDDSVDWCDESEFSEDGLETKDYSAEVDDGTGN